MNKPIGIPDELIVNKIHLVREQKVMFDWDLAQLYDVETKQLKRQVRRNIERFPEDFMFELTSEEFEILRSQIGTSRLNWGGTRYMPMAFTEQGVAMLSSVLGSSTAIQVNIQIIRTFTKMRELLLTSAELMLKMEKLEQRIDSSDQNIEIVFNYLKELIQQENQPRVKVGYQSTSKEESMN